MLTGLWLAAFVVSAASEPTVCTLDQPCGPDLTFSVAMVLCFVTVVLVWWRPLVAAVSAVGFALTDLTWDPLWQANLAWTLVAFPFVGYAGHVLHCARRQREVASEGAVASWRHLSSARVGETVDPDRRLVVGLVVVLCLIAGGGWFAYERAVHRDAMLEARSIVVAGLVTSAADEDDRQTIRLEQVPTGVPEEVRVVFIDVPQVGDEVRLRLDPQDSSWVHPVAEPPDRTWWVTISGGAALLASLLMVGRAERLLRLRRLERDPPKRGVLVRAVSNPWEHRTHLMALNSTRGLASLVHDESNHDAPDDQPREPMSGYLAGDVRVGGWVNLHFVDGSVASYGRLVDLPQGTTIDTLALDENDEDELLADSDPVPSSAVPAQLPVVVAEPWTLRVLGLLVAMAASALPVWLVPGSGLRWGVIVVPLWVGMALNWGIGRVLDRVRVTDKEFVEMSGFSVVRTSMGMVDDVRVWGDSVLVVLADGRILGIKPRGVTAQSVGAAIQRAVEVVPESDDGTAGSFRLRWTALILVVGMIPTVVTVITHLFH